MATKVKTTKKVDNIKKLTKDVNGFISDTSENIMDELLDNTAKWQLLAEKSIKGGLKLTAKNQDIFFNAMEMLKSQMQGGTKRFKNIFSKN